MVKELGNICDAVVMLLTSLTSAPVLFRAQQMNMKDGNLGLAASTKSTKCAKHLFFVSFLLVGKQLMIL